MVVAPFFHVGGCGLSLQMMQRLVTQVVVPMFDEVAIFKAMQEEPMTPEEIASQINGLLRNASPGRIEAFLPSPMIQNHAAFLHLLDDGALACAWFGGTLEGKSDISIFASVLLKGAESWGPPQRLSFDTAHSEQNPVFFTAPDGRLWLFHTSQPSAPSVTTSPCTRREISALLQPVRSLSILPS